MDKINEFHKANIVWSDAATEATGRRWHRPVKRIVCNDGFSVSVHGQRRRLLLAARNRCPSVLGIRTWLPV